MSTQQTKNDPSGYTFWTWLIAICLGIYLAWQWQQGHGPKDAATCCANSTTMQTPFSFSASNNDGYHTTGDANHVPWAGKSHDLLNWLKGGNDWKVEGHASHVTLSGTVDSEATKMAKGDEAQAFFGSAVSVDNQLVVKTTESAVAEVTNIAPPPAAKFYFTVGKSRLPADAEQTITPILAWVKDHPNAKVVISGFHDSTGNLAFNQSLAKKRAMKVSTMLTQSGVKLENIELRKPQNTEGDGNAEEARRTEVSVE